MRPLHDILDSFKHKDPWIRIEAIRCITQLKPDESAACIEPLIALLDDEFDQNKRGSAYGPTYITPETDLPVANAALDTLVVLGDISSSALLRLASEFAYQPKHYFAIVALGRLKCQNAIPYFIQHIVKGNCINHRVNFDQVDIMYLYEASAKALFDTNTLEWEKFKFEIDNENWFVKNSEFISTKVSIQKRIAELDKLMKGS